jgi:hypothetical protein
MEVAPTPDRLEDEQVTAPPVEEAFGWTAFGEPQISPQAQAQAEAEAQMVEVMEPPAPVIEVTPEEMPPVAEAVPEEIIAPPVEEIVSPDIEYPEKEPVEPIAEIPATETAPPLDIAFVPEVAPPIRDVAITPPPAAEHVPSTVEVEEPTPPEPYAAEPPPSADPFAVERAYLKKHPRDYDAWMGLAQGLWQADKRTESLEAYGRLIRAGKSLERVISDLESYLKQWPGVDVQTALGDAYMKEGRLQEALDLYRGALGTF